jgi:hypothetical protein
MSDTVEIPMAAIHIRIEDKSVVEDSNLYQSKNPRPRSPRSKTIIHENDQSDKAPNLIISPVNRKGADLAPLNYSTLHFTKKLTPPYNGVDSLLRSFKNNLEVYSRQLPKVPLLFTSKSLPSPPIMMQRESESYTDDINHEEPYIPDYDIQRSSSQLIDEHLQEIQVRINGHMKAALRYEKRDRIIGYPVTLLSSFVASTLMLNISSHSNKQTANVVGFILSVVSFVLSLSRDYLKYTTKFHAHDVSSKLYTNLLRSIEVRLIGYDITIGDKRDMFKDIVDQMSIIEQYELPIPNDINRDVRTVSFLPRSVIINHTLRNEK